MVRAFSVAGGEDTEFLAEGLREGLLNSLSKQSAISVIREQKQSQNEAAFALEGSVRGRGERIRLTFSLIDTANNCQVWSERYDRQSGDVFELEDEISRTVAGLIRIKVKQALFERLRDATDEELSVPDLLDKAAAYFSSGLVNNDKVEASLRLALTREPDNSMANAMLAYCLLEQFEFSPLALPATSEEAIADLADRAVKLQANSYFARNVAGMVAQDLRGDFEGALRHAQAALQANPDFNPAHGMIGIVKCHSGELDAGIAMLRQALDGSSKSTSFRDEREFAIAHFIAGDIETATELIGRLVDREPRMDRNRLVRAALLWLRGDADDAVAEGRRLREEYPTLSMLTKRPTWFGQADAAARFDEALVAIGLEEVKASKPRDIAEV